MMLGVFAPSKMVSPSRSSVSVFLYLFSKAGPSAPIFDGVVSSSDCMICNNFGQEGFVDVMYMFFYFRYGRFGLSVSIFAKVSGHFFASNQT